MPFDLRLFLLIGALSVVGIVVAVPGQVRGLLSQKQLEVSAQAVMVGAALQQSLIALGLAALGTLLAPSTGLSAPWFEAVAHGEGPALQEAARQLPAALILGAASSGVFILLYYQVFRPRVAAEDLVRIEAIRSSMGLFGRVMMGGVAEEVMFRWGVMSAMAWLAITVVGVPPTLGMWVAVVVAGLLFGLGHLPAVVAAGVRPTALIVTMAVVLNMVVAVAYGWLFWQHGLLAAISAHALLHLVWWMVEER